MASFTLLVTAPPLDSQCAYTAYRFARSICHNSQHKLDSVFFYQAGVLNSSAFQAVSSDEMNLLEKWQSLATNFAVPLQVCVTAADRRGIMNRQDAEEIDSAHFNLQSPFSEVGLGELAHLLQSSDKLVQF